MSRRRSMLLSETPSQAAPCMYDAKFRLYDAIRILCNQPAFSRSKFTGKERDAESGLDYFGARYYASSMGRWISPDWADKPEAVPYSQLDNPQSLNLYGYVNNNPLSKADKDGHCPDACVIEGVSAGVVVGIATVGASAVYLSTPAGQRSLSTFTSAFSSSVSNSVDSIKNFFSSSSNSNPAPAAPTAAPAAPTGATPVPTTAPAAPGTQSKPARIESLDWSTWFAISNSTTRRKPQASEKVWAGRLSRNRC
jgi:RHS repeat-associated protein